MFQGSWSVWDFVALGGIAWTLISFLFAFALGRVLRANRLPDADVTSDAGQSPEPVRSAPEAETVPVLVAVPDVSLLDQLVPAELALAEDDDEPRASGTRFKPIGVEQAAAPAIPRARSRR